MGPPELAGNSGVAGANKCQGEWKPGFLGAHSESPRIAGVGLVLVLGLTRSAVCHEIRYSLSCPSPMRKVSLQ